VKANGIIYPQDEKRAKSIQDKVMEYINSEKCDEWRSMVVSQPLKDLRGFVCKIVGHSVHSNMDNWLDYLSYE
jgi:hypothetical protein